MRDDLTCPICLEYFQDPYILRTCSHNLCRECIPALISEGHVVCPCCRSITDCPTAEIEQHLQLNLTVRNLVDSIKAQDEKAAAVTASLSDYLPPPPPPPRKSKKQKKPKKNSQISIKSYSAALLVVFLAIAFAGFQIFPREISFERSSGVITPEGDSLRDSLAESASSLIKIGTMLQSQGKLGEALGHFNKSYHIFVKLHGKGAVNIDTARSLSKIGSVLFQLGRLGPSLKYHRKSLTYLDQLFGSTLRPGDTFFNEVFQEIQNVAGVLFVERKYSEVIELQQRALGMYERGGGEGGKVPVKKRDVRNIVMSRTKIGQSLQAIGEHTEALDHLFKAHTLLVDLGGGDSLIEFASSFSNIGSVFLSLGSVSEAADFQRHATELLEEAHGGRAELETARAHFVLGSTCKQLGHLGNSTRHLQRALDLFRELNSVKSPLWEQIATAHTMIGHNLAQVWDGALWPSEAYDHHISAHAAFSKARNSTGCAMAMKHAADVLGPTSTEAMGLYKRALGYILELQGEQRDGSAKDLTEIYSQIGQVHLHREQWSEAASHLSEAATLLPKLTSNETLLPWVPSVFIGLARARQQLGATGTALVALDDLIALCDSGKGPMIASVCEESMREAADEYEIIGRRLQSSEDLPRALRAFESAARIRDAFPDADTNRQQKSVGKTVFAIGTVLFLQNNLRRSLVEFRRALALLDGHNLIGVTKEVAESLAYIGTILDLQSQPTEALPFLERSVRIFFELEDRAMIVSLQAAIAGIRHKLEL